MPNWIIHLGLQYGASHAIPVRHRDILLFMLGAVLPDIKSILYILFLDILNIKKGFDVVIWYAEPLHTPFVMVFVGLALALILKSSKSAIFISFIAGAFLHFFLDMFQKHTGFYQLIGYPFTFKNLNFNMFLTDAPVFFVATWVSLLILIIVLLFGKDRSHVNLRNAVDHKNIKWGILLLVGIACLPLLTKDLFYKNNVHYLNLFMNRQSFEGKSVALGVSQIVSTDPLEVVELNKRFALEYRGPLILKIGDSVSLRGALNGNTIRVEYLQRHTAQIFKRVTSLFGLFLFILMIINSETGVFRWRVRTLEKI